MKITSEGNSRAVVAVVTPIATPAYFGDPATVLRGTTAAPSSVPAMDYVNWAHGTVTTIAQASSELSLAAASSVVSQDNFQLLQSWMNDVNSSLIDIRNKLDTIAADLRDNTGILGT